jgi:hypothetical protein
MQRFFPINLMFIKNLYLLNLEYLLQLNKEKIY